MLLNVGEFVCKDFSRAQFLWWTLVFVFSGVSMYLLSHYLFRKKLIAFVSSMFYALNPWIINHVTHVLIVQAYAFVPLLFLFFVLLLDKKNFYYCVCFAISSFFIIPSPHMTFLVAVLLSLYALYRLWTQASWGARKAILINGLKAAICTFTILGFYSIPLITDFFTNEGIQGIASRFTVGYAGFFYGRDCTFLNVIRLLGFHDSFFQGSILGAARSPSPPIGWIPLSFLIPILWALPLLNLANRNVKDIWFLYLLIFLGILTATSVTMWNGSLFNVLRFLPLIDVNIYAFFLVFAGAILSGVAIDIIIDKCKSSVKRMSSFFHSRGFAVATYALLTFIVCSISYPIILWKDFRYQQIEYPTEYYQVADFINSQNGDFRILLLPPDTSIKHKWAPYFWISSSDGYLLNKPFFGRVALEATPQASLDFSNLIRQALRENSSLHLAKLLALANVKYIIVMNDTEAQPPYIWIDPSEIEHYLHTLNLQEGIVLVKRFGEIFVYKVDDKYFLPHIYSPQVIYSVSGKLQDLIKLAEFNDDVYVATFLHEPYRVVIPENGLYDVFTSTRMRAHERLVLEIDDELITVADSPIFNSWVSLGSMYIEKGEHYVKTYTLSSDGRKTPINDVTIVFRSRIASTKFTFEKIDTTKYVVHAKTNEPFILVFSESFDSRWRAYIADGNKQIGWIEAFFQKSVSDNEHFMINGYANAWYIDPKHLGVKGNEFTITIYYWPQSLFYVGWILSTSTFLGCIGYLAWNKKHRINSFVRSLIEKS
jgi:hypothetical protein